MLKKTLFNSVIYKGTLGAVYGIVAGLMLGLLIWILLNASQILHCSVVGGKGDSTACSYSGQPPFEFFVSMGMIFGAIIGSVFGSIAALKEYNKK